MPFFLSEVGGHRGPLVAYLDNLPEQDHVFAATPNFAAVVHLLGMLPLEHEEVFIAVHVADGLRGPVHPLAYLC